MVPVTNAWRTAERLSRTLRVVYSPVGSPNYELVPLPQDVKEIRHLTLLKSDILIEVRKMAWTAKTPIPFYVRARTGGEWRTHYMPNATCGPLIFLDATGQNVRTACGQRHDTLIPASP